jgi:hypothetical protein
MASSFTKIGLFWGFLSFATAIICGVGFYMPFWLKGSMENINGTHDISVHLSTFRRCNYPKMDRDSGTVAIVRECGRYTTFHDIPSLSWQIACISCGVGAGLSMLVGLIAIVGCCLADLISQTGAKTLGVIQLLAGLCIGAACVLYPNGWDSKEVKDVCGGTSGAFELGSCQLLWAYYLTVVGAGLNLSVFCFHLRPLT